MRVQFDDAVVPHSLLPSSIVLRFLIFLPVHVVHCSCLLFFAFPFVILAVRRGFEGDGEEREGMEAPRHVEPVILQRVGGPQGEEGMLPWQRLAALAHRLQYSVRGFLSLYLTPSSSPRMRWYLYNLGGESRMAFFLPPPLPRCLVGSWL